jgi:hypothetical protein
MSTEPSIEGFIEGKVQDCGCIAISEALQLAFNLGPGATFCIEAAADGSHLRLIPKSPSKAQPQPDPSVQLSGTACSA